MDNRCTRALGDDPPTLIEHNRDGSVDITCRQSRIVA
jgi:hypothetical protein